MPVPTAPPASVMPSTDSSCSCTRSAARLRPSNSIAASKSAPPTPCFCEPTPTDCGSKGCCVDAGPPRAPLLASPCRLPSTAVCTAPKQAAPPPAPPCTQPPCRSFIHPSHSRGSSPHATSAAAAASSNAAGTAAPVSTLSAGPAAAHNLCHNRGR
eukprot:scaffold27658_cov18-Tisochrysis_lutea.AAC.1